MLTLFAGTVAARAQTGPLSLDPVNARQGTALVLGMDAPGAPLAIGLPRGTAFDRTAAAKGARIGFGRYVMNVQGFLAPGGSSQLVWSLSASLGAPLQRGDLGSVTIAAALLGPDAATALLGPFVGAIPASTTVRARIVHAGGRLELRIPDLPARLKATAPTTATPARLELSLSAVRQVRQVFYHHIRVPLANGGFRVRRVRDHRLVGHNLLTTPSTCRSSWSYALRVGGRTSSGSIPCLPPLAVG